MMLDKEKQQNRGKQGWPDAGKGTGHGGDKKVITLDRCMESRLQKIKIE